MLTCPRKQQSTTFQQKPAQERVFQTASSLRKYLVRNYKADLTYTPFGSTAEPRPGPENGNFRIGNSRPNQMTWLLWCLKVENLDSLK